MVLPGLIDRVQAKPHSIAQCELIVDNFAGAGGASLGIEAALGRCVDIAINHSRKAIEIHTVNHPHTRHLCEDVWDVDPFEATGGRPVGLAWFSPDCKHFSKAKGGKPLDRRIRGLAWVVIRWARAVKPRVIILENVEEFQTWGPLDEHDMPIKAKAGQTFLRWKAQLRNLGYEVEHRELVAADYGTPTTRKRFVLVARCDGQPIRWPTRTHAPRNKAALLGLLPWRSAAECIDWSLPCPSIFERKRPLAEATMRRIARGLRKYVIEAAEPFIVCCNHSGDQFMGQAAGELLKTITGSRDAVGVVVPHISKYFGGVVGQSVEGPVPTVTAIDHSALVAAFILKHYGTTTGQDTREPMPTITSGGNHVSEVRAFLIKYYGNEKDGVCCRDPMHTIPCKDRMGLVTVSGVDYQIVDIGLRMLNPQELLKAQFGRFADQYVLHGTKSDQVAAIGNSVCPELAEAIVKANMSRGSAL
jgi:DNA (cytosine-5)-methyltransferase 1